MSLQSDLPSWFLPVFMYYLTLYYPSSVDPGQRVVDVPDQLINSSYDFIIVGAGSAGSVVASRLSEVEGWSVLLLEAGKEESVFSDTPFLAASLIRSEFDWNYTSLPQKRVCRGNNGICSHQAGRVLGGSSSVNGMVYARGTKANYDEWRDMGNEGWGYEDVLPYFLKSEDMQVEELAKDTVHHSTGGYLTVKYSNYLTPLAQMYIDAAAELGYEERDYNTGYGGISTAQLTQRGPSRCSTNKAFLRPCRNRSNLHVVQRARVTKLVVEDSVVTKVIFQRDGHQMEVSVNKEVVVSSGTFNTPQLLMVSGIGPKDVLKPLDIPVLQELPVGRNYIDHFYVSCPFVLNDSVADPEIGISDIVSYTRHSDGLLSLSYGGAEVSGYLPLNPKDNSTVDIQVFGLPFGFYGQTPEGNLMTIVTGGARVRSKGTVKVASGKVTDMPLIDPNSLAEQADYDLTIRGCLFAFDILKTEALKKYSPVYFMRGTPLCSSETPGSKVFCACLIKNYGVVGYHAVGTSKMGPKDDPTSVVGPDLMVHGMSNLRVADASIMPTIVGMNINAPTIMIGEKASDIIKDSWNRKLNQ